MAVKILPWTCNSNNNNTLSRKHTSVYGNTFPVNTPLAWHYKASSVVCIFVRDKENEEEVVIGGEKKKKGE